MNGAKGTNPSPITKQTQEKSPEETPMIAVNKIAVLRPVEAMDTAEYEVEKINICEGKRERTKELVWAKAKDK